MGDAVHHAHSWSSAFSMISGSAGWIQYWPSATWRAVWPSDIAWMSGWITVAASGPMMWAPSSRPLSGSARTLAKPVVSSRAHPAAMPA